MVMIIDDSSRGEVHWSTLPPKVLRSISQHLTTIMDYIRFRAVCPSWRSVITARPCHFPCQSPWLVLPREQEEGQVVNTHNRMFLSIPEDKLYNIHLPEEDHGRKYYGSFDGWLVLTICENDCATPVSLLNPITRAQVQLPPYPSQYQFSTRKVVGLSSPDGGTFLASLTWSDQISICRPGEESWTTLVGTSMYHQDAIFYNGRFYAVDVHMNIFAWDHLGPNARPTEVPYVGIKRSWHRPHSIGERCYLVESSGDLLLVIRPIIRSNLSHRAPLFFTEKFEVYKLNLGAQSVEVINNLGDRMLFLGLNTSISLSATDYYGWKGNHIYFTPDFLSTMGYDDHMNDDTGVFNLENGRTKPLPSYVSSSALFRPPPIWINPTLS